MAIRDATIDTLTTGEATARVAEVAGTLRSRLEVIVRQVAGHNPRPARLVSELDIDKSLASRLIRALRSDSSFELIHFVPAPTGLRIFIDAAEMAGVDRELCRPARDAAEDFQHLLDAFPGGRSSLDTLISESVVEVRERAERVAKQAVHKSMSYLLGFQCDTISSALILQPSETGPNVDGIEVSRREGIRRLRPSAPIALFSVSSSTDRPSCGGPRLEPFPGRGDPSDPLSFLLPGFCEPEDPPLELVHESGHTIFALAHDAVSLHMPVTVASALVVRDGWIPHRVDDQVEDGRSYLLHYPCKLLVRDLYIRDDLYLGAEPQVRLEFPSPVGAPRPRSENEDSQLSTLDMSAPIENLGKGLGRVAAHGVPEHSALLAHAFAASGWEPDRFRGYRTRIVYPPPMITLGWWIPLPLRQA